MMRPLVWLIPIAFAGCVETEPFLESESQELTTVPLSSWPAGDDPSFAPGDLVIDSNMNFVYWSRERAIHRVSSSGTGMLTYCDPCGGNSPTQLAAKIAVDSQYLYYVTHSTVDGGFMAVKTLLGGAEFPILLGIAIPAGAGATPDPETPLLVTGGFLYYAATSNNQRLLFRMPVAGGAATQFDTLPNTPDAGLAFDSTHVYAGTSTQILKYNKSTLAKTVAATASAAPRNFVVNGSHLYFTVYNGSSVLRFNRTLPGIQTPTTVFTDLNVIGQITSLALSSDASRIFYSMGFNSPMTNSEIRVRKDGIITSLLTVPDTMFEIDDLAWGAKPALFWGQGDGVWKGISLP